MAAPREDGGCAEALPPACAEGPLYLVDLSPLQSVLLTAAVDLRGALDLVVSAREEAAVRAHPAGTPWGGGGSLEARRRLGVTTAFAEHEWAFA